MDLFDVAQACRRRWYVTVPLALLTLAMAGLAYYAVPVVYRASAVVGLAPSPLTGGEGNGIINNGGTIMLANLTAAGIDSASVAQDIKDSSGATDFAAAVVAVPGGQMPMLNLVASARDRDTAVSAVTIAQQRAQDELDRIQANAGISERAYGVIYQVSGTPNVEELRPGRKKLVAGIVGLGVIVSVLAGLLWDLRKSREPKENGAVSSESAARGTDGGEDGDGDPIADGPDGQTHDHVNDSTRYLLDHESAIFHSPAGGRNTGEPGRADPAGRGLVDSGEAGDAGPSEPRSPAETERGGNATSRHRR